MWSYALLTLIVILAPAVTDSFMSDGVSFWARMSLFILIAIYGNIAVAVFDAFWRPARRSPSASGDLTDSTLRFGGIPDTTIYGTVWLLFRAVAIRQFVLQWQQIPSSYNDLQNNDTENENARREGKKWTHKRKRPRFE